MNKAAACAVGGFCPIVRSTEAPLQPGSGIPIPFVSNLAQELSMAMYHHAMTNGQICLQGCLQAKLLWGQHRFHRLPCVNCYQRRSV